MGNRHITSQMWNLRIWSGYWNFQIFWNVVEHSNEQVNRIFFRPGWLRWLKRIIKYSYPLVWEHRLLATGHLRLYLAVLRGGKGWRIYRNENSQFYVATNWLPRQKDAIIFFRWFICASPTEAHQSSMGIAAQNSGQATSFGEIMAGVEIRFEIFNHVSDEFF